MEALAKLRTMADQAVFANLPWYARGKRGDPPPAPKPAPPAAAATPTSPIMPSSLPVVTFISLEATIGAGKSTQLAMLKEQFAGKDDVVFLDEPDREWEEHGLIHALYSGKLDKCAFQMIALTSRITDLINLVLSGARFIVSERSPLSDYLVFANSNLEGIDLCGYEYCFRKLQALLEKHAVFNVHMIYLNVEVDTAVARIGARGRHGEQTEQNECAIPKEYLQLLEDAHVEMVDLASTNTLARHCRDAPEPESPRLTTCCTVIDGNESKEAIGTRIQLIVLGELVKHRNAELSAATEAMLSDVSPTSVIAGARRLDPPLHALSVQP